jgi:hypothetical protein
MVKSMTNLLEQHKLNKRIFDIHSPDDISEFQYFLENNRWKNTCPFHVRWPHLNVVDMIKNEIIHEFVNTHKKVETKYNFEALESAMR